jgi:hypothetical protein
VQQDYKIDTHRIFLGGISMGGMGAWSIGAHYPDKFAGLAVLAGRSDFYIWKDVQRGALPQWKRKLVRGEFGAELIPNYRHLPSVIVHGTADWIMPMKQSRRMARLLGEAGFPTRMVELEGATHGSWTEMLTAPPVIAGLKEWQREEAPERVTFRTWTTKYDGAYWVRLTGLQSWAEEVEIDASCEPETRTIEVETRNVTGLRLQRPSGPWPGGGDVQVIWNGQTHAVEPDEAGYVTVGRGPPAEGLWKRRGLCGPIREAFADRFVFVYGGEKGGPSYQRTIVAATDWLRFAQGMPDIMSAEKVTPELMKEANLILYGTPEDNPIMAEVAPKLPVRIEAGEYVVGERRYEASKFGFSVVYPNPLAPERYVVVNSGPVWGKGLAGNHKYDMLPDFIVFTEGVSEDGTESNTAVTAGFFDQEWQFDPGSTWFFPEAEAEAPAEPPAPATGP